MTDNYFGTNVLSLYGQLIPWVQALLGLGLCVVVLGVAYILKEIVVAIMQPLCRVFPAQNASGETPCREWKQFQRDINRKIDRLLDKTHFNFPKEAGQIAPFRGE
ncbi:hypothetical protein [Pseudochelatococcus sp. G4_1912]|uniref:hypothetical protein n=1 Tax=Pseudochelatococcus sp. G4_1912 TaxID=3114288 RepID=UPI0039C65267